MRYSRSARPHRTACARPPDRGPSRRRPRAVKARADRPSQEGVARVAIAVLSSASPTACDVSSHDAATSRTRAGSPGTASMRSAPAAAVVTISAGLPCSSFLPCRARGRRPRRRASDARVPSRRQRPPHRFAAGGRLCSAGRRRRRPPHFLPAIASSRHDTAHAEAAEAGSTHGRGRCARIRAARG